MVTNYYSAKNASRYLGVTEDTLRKYTKEGKIKGTKPAGKLYYHKDELDKFLNSDSLFEAMDILTSTDEEILERIDKMHPDTLRQALFDSFKKTQEVAAIYENRIKSMIQTVYKCFGIEPKNQ